MCIASGRLFGLQPHRTKTFKLSPDPLLIDKVRDIVGVYLNPPPHAAVFCVDEKPQIQALDRTAPLLPLRPGQAERRPHDYKRNGTTSLFAALEVKTQRCLHFQPVSDQPPKLSTLFLERCSEPFQHSVKVHTDSKDVRFELEVHVSQS